MAQLAKRHQFRNDETTSWDLFRWRLLLAISRRSDMHFFARAVIVVSGCFVCIGAAQTNESVRTIPYAPNRPLSERLLPDDDVVVVTMRADEVVTPRRPTARAMASALLRDYTAIVLRLDRSEGLLVDNGRWIASRLTGEVVERLNTVKTTGTAALKAGTGVSVAMHGASAIGPRPY